MENRTSKSQNSSQPRNSRILPEKRIEITLKLKRDFYKIGSVKEAIRDFGEICEGRITSKEGPLIEVRLIPKESSPNIEREFCNYVLGLMKNNSLV